jgi:hypothetical protein
MTADDLKQELERKVQMRDIQWVNTFGAVLSVWIMPIPKTGRNSQELLTKDKDGKPRGHQVDEHSNSLIIPPCVMI